MRTQPGEVKLVICHHWIHLSYMDSLAPENQISQLQTVCASYKAIQVLQSTLTLAVKLNTTNLTFAIKSTEQFFLILVFDFSRSTSRRGQMFLE